MRLAIMGKMLQIISLIKNKREEAFVKRASKFSSWSEMVNSSMYSKHHKKLEKLEKIRQGVLGWGHKYPWGK